MRSPEQGSSFHGAATLGRTSESVLRSVEDAELVIDLGCDLSAATGIVASPSIQSCVARFSLRVGHRVGLTVVGKDVSHIYLEI